MEVGRRALAAFFHLGFFVGEDTPFADVRPRSPPGALRHARPRPAAPSTYRAERRKNAETSLCADEHAQFVVLVDFMRGRTRTTYDGIAGDVLLTWRYATRARLRLFEAGRLEELAADMAANFCLVVQAPDLVPLLSPALRPAASRALAIERIVAELTRHAAAASPIMSFYFWNRTRREIALAPFAMMQRAVPVVHAPYLDHAFDAGFRDEVIARAHPRNAGLPSEELRAPERDARAAWARHGRETARLALARLTRRPRTVDRARLLTRALRTLASPAYAARSHYVWLPALYLLQLDEAARGEWAPGPDLSAWAASPP